MTMKHRDTGEIVFVMGFFTKPTKGTYARCLCDARLHPERKGQRYEGSVEMEIAAHNLVPVELPRWNEIETLYPKGRFEQIRQRKLEEHRRNVECNAVAIYNQELSRLRKDGIPDDLAENMAARKREDFLSSRVAGTDGNGECSAVKAERSAKW